MHSITGVFFYEKNIKKTIDKRKTMCYNKGELKEKEMLWKELGMKTGNT